MEKQSDLLKKLEKVRNELKDVRYQMGNPNISQKKYGKLLKDEGELAGKEQEIQNKLKMQGYQPSSYGANGAGASGYDTLSYSPGVNMFPTPLPQPSQQSTDGFFSCLSNSAKNYLMPSNKPSAEDLAWKREEEERERQRELRRRRLAEETAATDAAIRTTAIESKARTHEDLTRIVSQQRARLAEEEQRESERVAKLREENNLLDAESREFQRKLESEREAARRDQERRDAELVAELSRSSEKARGETERIRMERQRQLDEDARRMRAEDEQRRRELDELDRKNARELEKQQEELRKLDEEIRRTQEEAHRKYEEMRRAASEQFEMLMEMVKRAEWSRAIEANWSNRLNALKSTKRRIDSAVRFLNEQLGLAKTFDRDPKLVSARMEHVRSELAEVQRVMDREVVNLEKMYEFSRKQFVRDIQHSLRTVSTKCALFGDYLSSRRVSSRSEAHEVYDQVAEHENAVYEAYLAIPTMDALKRNDYSGVSSGAIEDGNEDGHVIKIEEID